MSAAEDTAVQSTINVSDMKDRALAVLKDFVIMGPVEGDHLHEMGIVQDAVLALYAMNCSPEQIAIDVNVADFSRDEVLKILSHAVSRLIVSVLFA